VRHAAFHQPVVDGPLGQLLTTVVKHIAHLPIRTRGTFCGSLANADGASEWCLVSATLQATLVARSVRGERLIPAAEFFVGFMTTALEADEMLVEVRLPLLSSQTRFGFEEYSRRSGDFAQAMALVVFELQGGLMSAVRIGVGGVSGSVLTVPAAEAVLEGQLPAAGLFERAAQAVADAIAPSDMEPEDQAYRRDLARTVVIRALEKAVATPSNTLYGSKP
jgi:carbon-monoxide dehydrogenase medium subunit